MRPRPTPTARRPVLLATWVGLLAAVLVVGAALPAPPATGAPTSTLIGPISGRVVLPEGYTGDVTSLSVQGHGVDGTSYAGGTPAADGTFTMAYARTGTTYRIWFYGGDDLLTGYWTSSGELVQHAADATPVTAPATGIEIHARLGESISGRIDMPAGSYVRSTQVSARDAEDRTVRLLTSTSDQFTLGGLWPDERYRVHLHDTLKRVSDGYYTDGGWLTPRHTEATTVPVGTSGLVLRPETAPYLAGRVALPDDVVFDDGPEDEYDHPVVRVRRVGPGEGSSLAGQTMIWSTGSGTHFRYGQLDPSARYRVHIDYGAATSASEQLRSGCWDGNYSPLSATCADAALLRPSRGDILLPLLTENLTRPRTWGSPRVGATLFATRGTWRPADSTVTFQWLRHGRPISGATASSYRVRTADRGLNLSVRVTATSPDHTRAAVRSAVVRVPG